MHGLESVGVIWARHRQGIFAWDKQPVSMNELGERLVSVLESAVTDFNLFETGTE